MSSTGVQASCNNKLLQISPGFKRKPINFLSCQQRSQDASHAVVHGANEQGRVHLPFKLWDVVPQHSGLYFFPRVMKVTLLKWEDCRLEKKACLQSVTLGYKEFHKEFRESADKKSRVHVQRSHRGKRVHLSEKKTTANLLLLLIYCHLCFLHLFAVEGSSSASQMKRTLTKQLPSHGSIMKSTHLKCFQLV